MNLVWAGKRFVNLDYLITAEDAENASGPGGPPHLRLMLEGGTVIPCSGEPAAIIWRRLRELADGGTMPPDLGPPAPDSVDPRDGSVLPSPDARPESA